jgi:hypothetical protein
MVPALTTSAEPPMPPSPRRRLRAALVLTVQGALAMGCESVPADAPVDATALPPLEMGRCIVPEGRATPRGLPCTREGATCYHTHRPDVLRRLPHHVDVPRSDLARGGLGGVQPARARRAPRARDATPPFDAWRPEDVPPDDVPRPDDAAPPSDVARACPLTRPAERAACEPEAVLPECRYPSLDALCPAGSSDVVVCDPVARWWRWSPTACRTNPCPAALPAELSACSPSASTPCAYTQPCGGSLSIRVWAFCMLYRDNRVWLHRFPDGLCDGGL